MGLININNYSNPDKINIAGFYPETQCLGPGKRSVIWLQGCLKRCKDCITKSMQPLTDKCWIDAIDLADFVGQIENIEGVTFLGGEPFLQAEALCKAVWHLKKIYNLTIMIYTGYALNELTSLNDIHVTKILNFTDILVDGSYEKDKDEAQKWRGSENQQIYFLSERYKKWQWVKEAKGRDIEIIIDSKGHYLALGIPPEGFYELLP
ncbi:MAG: radical SAM protein [Desulfamplus sp.]|nr:radical SAM protein [Desulfamplus sp.]